MTKTRLLTSTQRIRFAVVLTTLALIATAATCTACVAKNVTITPTRVEARSVKAEWAAAVEIKASCKDGLTRLGTGTIIGKKLVLTAKHVVQESWERDVEDEFTGVSHKEWVNCNAEKVTVTEVNGDEHEVAVEAESGTGDIARLVLEEGEFVDPPATLGPRPELGDPVCAVAMYPQPWRRCGTAQVAPMNHIRFDFVTEHGNSGAGIYDLHGRFVGVLTNQWLGEHHQIIGGEGTAIISLPWIFQE